VSYFAEFSAGWQQWREELKELLREVGRQGRGITDKSFKMLGVTKRMEAGGFTGTDSAASEVEVPLRYKHNLKAYKLKLARLIPKEDLLNLQKIMCKRREG
jgi:hypothetical protein